jgi:hypothetical protein
MTWEITWPTEMRSNYRYSNTELFIVDVTLAACVSDFKSATQAAFLSSGYKCSDVSVNLLESEMTTISFRKAKLMEYTLKPKWRIKIHVQFALSQLNFTS